MKKLIIALLFLTSCSGGNHHGVVVVDSNCNYYELDGYAALGQNRYYLVKVDTTKYKPVGFKPCK